MNKLVACVIGLLLTSLLSGCIAAGALAVGGATGGAIAADRRSFSTMADDEKIVYKATRKMGDVPGLSTNSHIVLVSYNHVVLLAGQVATPELRDQAKQIAQDTPKVRRVFNELTIGPPIGTARRSKDAAITTNIKTRFVATTNVSARQIKVVTEDGVVYLMGITSRDQANAAAEIARNSTGVKRVVKLIEYLNS